MTKHLKSSGEHDYFIREKGERSEMENKIKKKNRKPWNGEGSVTVGRLAIESLLQMASRSVGEGSSGTDSDSGFRQRQKISNQTLSFFVEEKQHPQKHFPLPHVTHSFHSFQLGSASKIFFSNITFLLKQKIFMTTAFM